MVVCIAHHAIHKCRAIDRALEDDIRASAMAAWSGGHADHFHAVAEGHCISDELLEFVTKGHRKDIQNNAIYINYICAFFGYATVKHACNLLIHM